MRHVALRVCLRLLLTHPVMCWCVACALLLTLHLGHIRDSAPARILQRNKEEGNIIVMVKGLQLSCHPASPILQLADGRGAILSYV
jgi:hypothetical protein